MYYMYMISNLRSQSTKCKDVIDCEMHPDFRDVSKQYVVLKKSGEGTIRIGLAAQQHIKSSSLSLCQPPWQGFDLLLHNHEMTSIAPGIIASSLAKGRGEEEHSLFIGDGYLCMKPVVSLPLGLDSLPEDTWNSINMEKGQKSCWTSSHVCNKLLFVFLVRESFLFFSYLLYLLKCQAYCWSSINMLIH